MSPQATTPTDTIYVVKSGDSLSKIALQFYGNAQLYPRIAQANNLDPAKPIQVGQRLKVPGATGTRSATATPPDAQTLVGPPAPAKATEVARITPGFDALNLSDWRVWAGGGLILGAIYLLWKSSNR